MIGTILQLCRARQWLKNLMLFFPPFLGGTLFSNINFIQMLIPFSAFCFVSSATYIVNDVFDKENDRHHPEKCTRPIASGKIPVSLALIYSAVMLISGMLMAWHVSAVFCFIMLVYILVSIAYSARLKEIVLLDIFCISAGFMLRLLAGGAAFEVRISGWLFLSVFLLSLFLSAGKRLSEKQSLGERVHHHRKVLLAYPKGFLEGVIYMTGGSVLVTYSMYAITRHSALLLYSVPLCCFGLLRYIIRIRAGKNGDPTESLLKDLPLFVVGVVWAIMVGWGIYGG